MSSDRIAQLHEQAAERYLNGDYNGALQAWRDVLTMDPKNEQAMDGVRMASQFAEPIGAAAPAPSDVERELDQGLRIFDSLGAQPASDLGATMILNRRDVDGMIDRKPAPPGQQAANEPDPIRQSEGIDFGDLSAVDPIPLGMPTPAPGAAPSDEGSYGLEALSSVATPSGPPSAAAVELNRRVLDLLADARAKAAAGDRDEAIAILSRLAILDEDNTDAAVLREQLMGASASDLDKIEEAIIEGVAALEADRLDDAERCFSSALALSPGHREAQHYLDKVAERRAGSPDLLPTDAHAAEDLLAQDLPASPPEPPLPSNEAVPLAIAPSGTSSKGKPARAPRAAASEILDAPVPKPGRRFALPSLKWLLFGGIGATALVCGAIALPHFTGGSTKRVPVPPPPRPARAAKARPAAATAAAAKAPTAAAAPMSAAERGRVVAKSIDKGRSQADAGNYGAAVVSFNDALRLEPANVDAKSGLDQAAAAYKAHKAEQESLDSIRMAFRDGEYTSGLRLAYRLSPSVPQSFVDGVKVAGWYNLAVVALRAGDCREALSHLGDALEIVPGDAESETLREFAQRYLNAPKDRSFLDQVEALAFRPIPSTGSSVASH